MKKIQKTLSWEPAPLGSKQKIVNYKPVTIRHCHTAQVQKRKKIQLKAFRLRTTNLEEGMDKSDSMKTTPLTE